MEFRAYAGLRKTGLRPHSESYGEDTYIGKVMGSAAVKG